MLHKLFKRSSCEKSAEKAKKRLQFALIYDRIQVSETLLDDLNKDIEEVISRYFVIDKNSCRLVVNDSDRIAALVVNIPILETRHRVTGKSN